MTPVLDAVCAPCAVNPAPVPANQSGRTRQVIQVAAFDAGAHQALVESMRRDAAQVAAARADRRKAQLAVAQQTARERWRQAVLIQTWHPEIPPDTVLRAVMVWRSRQTDEYRLARDWLLEPTLAADRQHIAETAGEPTHADAQEALAITASRYAWAAVGRERPRKLQSGTDHGALLKLLMQRTAPEVEG